MAFRNVNGRGRVVRRVAVAAVAAGIVALGALVVPSVASASSDIGQSDALAVSAVEAPEEGAPKDHPKDPEGDEHEKDPKGPEGEDPKEEDPKEEDPGGIGDGTGSIRPGALMDGVCTANFVYRSGDRVFLGYAAHCAADLVDPVIDQDYCMQEPFALGTEVVVQGAEDPATLAYTSWEALQANNVGPGDMCMYNDFALAELSAADADNVHPTVPEIGGPVGLADDGVAVGDTVYAYLPNFAQPAVKRGVVLQVEPEGLGYTVGTVPNSAPGDSGGGYMDGDGNAFGSLSGGNAATSLVTDLAMALNYAIDFDDSLDGLEIVPGGSDFSTDGVPMTPVPEMADFGSVLSVLEVLALG